MHAIQEIMASVRNQERFASEMRQINAVFCCVPAIGRFAARWMGQRTNPIGAGALARMIFWLEHDGEMLTGCRGEDGMPLGNNARAPFAVAFFAWGGPHE